jgi:hypothetical protein
VISMNVLATIATLVHGMGGGARLGKVHFHEYLSGPCARHVPSQRENALSQEAHGPRIHDHRDLFSNEEVIGALMRLGFSLHAADALCADIMALEGEGWGMWGEGLYAMALVSHEAGERARLILRETPEVFAARVASLRARLPLYNPDGSPRSP